MPHTHLERISIGQRLKAGSAFGQWLLLGAVLVILGSAIGWDLYSEYNSIDAVERERLVTQAKVVSENLEQQLLSTNIALDLMRNNLALVKNGGDNTLVNRRLQGLSSLMPGLRALLIINAEGIAVASNRGELIGQSFSNRDYFQVPRGSRNPATLHVTPPYRNVNAVYSMTLAKTLVDEGGGFAGVVAATLAPEYFNILLNSVLYAEDMRSAVIHGDGKMAFRIPGPQDFVGVDLTRNPSGYYTQHMKSGRRTSIFAGVSGLTGESRLTVFSTVQPAAAGMDKPLVITTSRHLAAVFAGWYREVYIHLGLFGLLVLICVSGLYFVQHRQRAYKHLVAEQDAERMQAQETLARESHRNEVFLRNASDGVHILSADGTVLEVSDSFCRMLGYTREELLGANVSLWDAQWSRQELKQRLAEQMANQGNSLFQTRHRRRDGSIFEVEVSGHPLELDGDRALFNSARDITERNRSENELVAARQAAEKANLAKSHFLAAASHDLRQPIQAINLFCLALAKTGLSEEQKKISDYLELSAKSLGDLLNALLDISKFDAGLVKPVYEVIETKALIRNIGAEVALLASEKHLRFRLFSRRRELAIFTDAKLLRSLLGNLVDNAIKYTRSGGVLVGIRHRGRQALIQVWDTGIGIAPEHRDKIFEEYFQIENQERDKAKGLGLGLAIAKRIAAVLESEVMFRSRPGKGSVFEIRLPLADERLKQSASRLRQQQADGDARFSFGARRIVVIEDDRTVAEAIKLSLESQGMSVTTYDTAEDALASPDIADADFYVSDLRLPGLNGREFLDELERRSPKQIRAVILTGDTSSERVRMAQASSWTVLFKPVDLPSLLAAIRSEDLVH